MKIVIQCCATKNDQSGRFSINGSSVKFVAHPEKFTGVNTDILFRPDDTNPSTSKTWREYLRNYNATGNNPDDLLECGALYSRKIYGELRDSIKAENFYVLSAGWGLIRSDFLLPDYDITFSYTRDKWKRRLKSDSFHDFKQLTQENIYRGETVYFFGGIKYLPLYYELTRDLNARKVVYYVSEHTPTEEGFEYVKYACDHNFNWQYSCVSDFLNDRIAK